MPTSAANSAALPSMTGSPATGPMSPRPRMAVPFVMTATCSGRFVYSRPCPDRPGWRDTRARRRACRCRAGSACVEIGSDAASGSCRRDDGRTRGPTSRRSAPWALVDPRVEQLVCGLFDLDRDLPERASLFTAQHCTCSITSCSSAMTCSTLASAPGLCTVSTSSISGIFIAVTATGPGPLSIATAAGRDEPGGFCEDDGMQRGRALGRRGVAARDRDDERPARARCRPSRARSARDRASPARSAQADRSDRRRTVSTPAR